MEATTTAAALAKYSAVIAGFIGSIMSLTFMRDLTRRQAMCAVCVGFFSSVYMSAFVISFFKLPTDAPSRDGVAFLIGLLAMNLVPAVRAMLERLAAKQGS